jgi:hypothetical protein
VVGAPAPGVAVRGCFVAGPLRDLRLRNRRQAAAAAGRLDLSRSRHHTLLSPAHDRKPQSVVANGATPISLKATRVTHLAGVDLRAGAAVERGLRAEFSRGPRQLRGG